MGRLSCLPRSAQWLVQILLSEQRLESPQLAQRVGEGRSLLWQGRGHPSENPVNGGDLGHVVQMLQKLASQRYFQMHARALTLRISINGHPTWKTSALKGQ